MTERTRSEDSQAQIKERLVDAEVRMDKSLESLHKDLGSVRIKRDDLAEPSVPGMSPPARADQAAT